MADKLKVMRELADTWDLMAAQQAGNSKDRREQLRECADAVRMILDMEPPSCPHAHPFTYCQTCVVSPCPIGLGKQEER